VRSNKPLTAKQEEVAAIFNLVRSFCNTLAEIFQLTMSTATNTGINNAFSLIKEKAVTGTYPSFAIDYTKVSISKGSSKVSMALNPVVTSTDPKRVKVEWQYDNTDSLGKSDDKAVIAIYCPELGRATCVTAGPERHVLQAELNAHGMSGRIAHAWILFRSADGLNSDSIYIGTVTVA
jgi:hypothetical protein